MAEQDVSEVDTAAASTIGAVPIYRGPDTEAPSAAMPQKPHRIAHYPLDFELPFYLYEHRPITPRDLMLNSIVADYMRPSRVKPQTYYAYVAYPAEFDPINAQDKQLGMDLKLMRKMLFTSHYQDPPPPGKPQLHRTTFEFSRNKRVLRSVDKPVSGPVNAPPTIGDEVLDLVQRYYFETDGAIVRLWLERQRPPREPTGPEGRRNGQEKLRIDAREKHIRHIWRQQRRERKVWRDEDTVHLGRLDSQLAMMQERSPKLEALYDGGPHLALVHRLMEADAGGERLSKPSSHNYHFTLASKYTGPSHASSTFWQRGPYLGFFIQPRWCNRRDFKAYCEELPPSEPDRLTGRGRPKTRFFEEASSNKNTSKPPPDNHGRVRGKSEPPPGSFCAAKLPDPRVEFLPGKLMAMFPRLPLSVIDRRSRRRSLSRSHVANMFDWDCKDLRPPASSGPNNKQKQKHKQQPDGNPARVRAMEQKSKKDPSIKKDTSSSLHPPCANCTLTSHPLAECLRPCGYCGAPNPTTFQSLFKTKFSPPKSQGIPPLHGLTPPSGFPGDTVQEIFIAAPGDNTLILNGHDTILLSPGGGIEWQRAGGTRDRVVLGPSIDSVPGVGPVGDWFCFPDGESSLPVGVHGPGKHGNPHMADKCPVPREGRCKCVAFPQYHVAGRCRVRCSRDCGNRTARGKFGHRNAMTCKSRCCMCGIKGHAGRECRLNKCRCGEQHLGQDCRFMVECRVEGCDRFLCGVHCRSCGGSEKPFLGWECVKCRGERREEDSGTDESERRDELETAVKEKEEYQSLFGSTSKEGTMTPGGTDAKGLRRGSEGKS